MTRDPDSGKGRRQHVDHAFRDVPTRPGVHVTDDTDDDFPAHATPVEALTDAANAIAAHAISRAEAERIRARLADLETWRKATDEWRLKLTGVADTNGRMGRLDDTVAKLRDDVGPPDARRREREAVATIAGDRKRVIGALVTAAILAGGGVWAIREKYDASVRATGVDQEWRRGVDEKFRALFSLFGRTTP